MSGKHIVALFILLPFLFFSCKKEKMEDITLLFAFRVDEQSLIQDQRIYRNLSGNLYEVNEIMFFISDVTLYKSDGSVIMKEGIHYVDIDIPSTLKWEIDAIPQGDYLAMSFTFGLTDAQNQSYRFVNPPECDMSWPTVIGGGYHYMKINGKWLAEDGQVKPFNLHTGRGQIYDNEGYVTQFVDNSFTVRIGKSFSLKKNGKNLLLVMNVNQWFNAQQLFDLDEWGGGIMQNQAAQELLKANGPYVFDLQEI